jgi:deoxyribodipyrimidine photo-lyase
MKPDPQPVSIVLFTRDLRLHDNPGLRAAAAEGAVVPLFVLDDAIGRAGYLSANRARFLTDSLTDLDQGLRQRGGRLVVRVGNVVDEVCRVARGSGARRVHIAADVSGYAQHRARRLGAALAAEGVELLEHSGVVTAVPPGEIAPAGARHMAVFTPYHRRWLEFGLPRPLPAPKALRLPDVTAGSVPPADKLCPGETSPNLPAGGEAAGRQRLTAWVDSVDAYAETNDLLAVDGTSRLSPYLHFGCVSANEVVHRIGTATAGRAAFVRQLAWRDFHHQVLSAAPDVASHDYRGRGDRWRDDPEQLDAWRSGRTGYPIVDAGMRQLLAEGWMHNRARLIVGSFLTKTLYLDWRAGARHFLAWLVDGDIANNQLNWQWIAGTGTDTRPNRVLNPLLQAERYDPDGTYVRRHVPELAGVAGAAVHAPWKLGGVAGYPEPILELSAGRERFLQARKG